MSLVLNIAHNVSLLLEGWTLLLALFFVAGAIALPVVIINGRRKPAVVLAAALALSVSVLIPNSLLATPATWQAMYAAYVAAPPERSTEFSGDIHEYWSTTARGVLVRDWYFIAHRWGVCHELWRQSDCIHAPGQREAMGIARDLLTEVASSSSQAPILSRSMRRPNRLSVRLKRSSGRSATQPKREWRQRTNFATRLFTRRQG